MKFDRRIVFLLLGIGVTIPFFLPMRLKMNVTPPVKSLYQVVDATEPDKAIIVSFDFAPSTAPENLPMGIALLRHCFSKKIKVIIMAVVVQGAGLAEIALDEVLKDYPDLKYGEDYVFLGYVPGYSAVILKLGESVVKAYELDYYGSRTADMPIFRDIKNFDDISVAVSLTGSAISLWITYAYIRYGVKVGVGATAVYTAESYPYLQTGQLVGFLGGLKGAAEYETLLEEDGIPQRRKQATIGMDSQSIVHLLIIALVVIGNILYWRRRR